MNTSDRYTSIPLKHFRIGPTRFGWLFVVVVGAMLLGSINYNNNLGFLVTFLLGSMALVSIVHSYRNLSGFQVRSIETQPVFAGQFAVVVLQIDCGKTAASGITCEFEKSGAKRVNAKAGSVVQVDIPVPAEKRGRIETGPLTVSSVFPFGLFYCRGRCDAGLEYIVYPEPGSFRKLTVEDLLQAHAPEGITAGQIDDFKGLRHFQTGDATAHIFWKAFSKGQGLLIKEFEGASLPSLFFSLDKIKGGDIEIRLSRLCAMILKAESLQLAYGLRLPGSSMSPDTGRTHRHLCLRALALF